MKFLLYILLFLSACGANATPVEPPSASKDWSDLLSFRPSLPTQTALAARSVSGDAWRPLRIENGVGVVNLDFFGVEIDKIPIVNGKEMSLSALQNLVRENFTTLIDPTQSDFGSYSPVDQSKWQSDAPADAVMRFDLKYKNYRIEGGSVVVSYFDDSVWRFSTIYSQRDWKHPVSGTREFGVTKFTDGRVVLYTRAADRPTAYWDGYVTEKLACSCKDFLSLVGLNSLSDFIPSLLDSGQKIWEEYQKRLVVLINNNGGHGKIIPPIIVRPAWNDVSHFYSPAVSWLGQYVVVKWDGPTAELILPLKMVNGRAIGLIGDGTAHPRGVVWIDNNKNNLPDVGETQYLADESKPSEVVDLGTDGRVVGMVGRRYVSPRAVIWPVQGGLNRIPVPNSQYSRFDAISGSNMYAGTAQFTLSNNPKFTSTSRAFLWKDINADGKLDPGEQIILSPLVVDYPTESLGILDDGTVIGTAINDKMSVRAVIWIGGNATPLGSFTSGNSIPTAINRNRNVVGYADVKGGTHAFLWENPDFVDLGTLGGPNSYANSINLYGVVVGSAETSSGERHGVLWSNRVVSDLNEMIFSQSEWKIRDARYIDDDGIVLITGTYNKKESAGLLIPLH